MNEPANRGEIGQLLAERGMLGPAVEVGVYEGMFAEEILSWGVEKLYLVDLWRHVPDGKAELDQSDERLEEVFQECLARVDRDRVVVLRGWSTDMAQYIPDDSCGFVNIDASHFEPDVRNDTAAYWPKLQSGGIMAWHDYNIAGVRRAVRGFAANNNLVVHAAVVSEHDITAWVEKP